RPVADGIVAGLVAFGAALAKAGAQGVNQSWLKRLKVFVSQMQSLEGGRPVVRGKDVGLSYELAKDFVASRRFNIESETFLVAVVGLEGVGELRGGHSGEIVIMAIEIPLPWRLDFDDFGPEIGQNCTRRRGEDHCADFDDAKIGQRWC